MKYIVTVAVTAMNPNGRNANEAIVRRIDGSVEVHSKREVDAIYRILKPLIKRVGAK